MDKMFAKYPQTDETMDLKEEVIGNLEAQIEDMKSNGISFEEAFRVSIEKVENFDGLIEGVKIVDKRHIVNDMFQWILIYTLITWIVTIPLTILWSVRRISWLILVIIIVIGISYLLLHLMRDQLLNGQITVNLFKIAKMKKTVWFIWSIFLLIAWGGITGMTFGSNLWFSIPISINGPYEFATIAIGYALPLISIIIPLLINRLERTIYLYEERAANEV